MPATEGEPGSPVRHAVVRFAASMALALLLLLVGALIVGRVIAEDRALEDAEDRTSSLADNLVAPLVDQALVDGTSGSRVALGQLLRAQIKSGNAVHLKVWSEDGKVLWSDHEDQIGQSYALHGHVASAFTSGQPVSEISDLDEAENVEDRGQGQLLEVYAPGRGADGTPFLMEMYQRTDQLHQERRSIVLALLGLSTGVLVLFGAAMLPLGLGLARRVERAQHERDALLRHALNAAELERRRVAEELHDGVIQNLAGVGYLLPVVRERVASGSADAGDVHHLDRIGSLVSRNIAALRSMMVSIYPTDLQEVGLAVALQNLVRDGSARTVQTSVVVDRHVDCSPVAERLVYRIVREGLRNVANHSGADTALVEVHQDGGTVVVSVTDDGVGPPEPLELSRSRKEGHLGLRLLRDTLVDVGGSIDLRRGDDGGARLICRLPADLQA
ncbi:MAG: hypothetical protein HOQ22_18285 [Nocardioidaceae bacterium]|nr:hypothetical protein [Nocardioidaceae bacterium]NUS52974.1 hypothetical protein [Nocardioidaceae bacterium]